MFKAVSFDCCGTLVDWEAGIRRFLAQTFRERGIGASIEDVVKAREDIEFEMIQARYRRYAEILRQSLREAFEQLRIPYSNRDGDRLVESVGTWPLFADTKPALEKLSRKYRLAIISNIDNDMIRSTKLALGIKFRLTVTAQYAKAYKPSIRPFQIALQKLNCNPGEVLHVSSEFRFDIPPAHELGFKTAWVNRKHEPKPALVLPDFQFDSLMQLTESIDNL